MASAREYLRLDQCIFLDGTYQMTTFPTRPSPARQMLKRLGALIVAATALFLFAPPAHAVPHYAVYDGLLPAHTQPQQGAPLTAADLAGKKIVIVPSRNFNWYADWWMRQHDPERGRNRQAWLEFMGVDRDTQARSGLLSDPRNIAGQFVETLTPYVGSVSSATDLASAHAQGADYIVVVDYFMTVTMTMRIRSEAGVYVLDNALHQVFSASGTSDVPYNTGGLAVGAAQANAEQGSMVASVNALMPPILNDIRDRLGPAR
jgi:hypothetical protein